MDLCGRYRLACQAQPRGPALMYCYPNGRPTQMSTLRLIINIFSIIAIFQKWRESE
jgi:hypothetical protein